MILPEEINTLSEKARNYGADIILVHGETVVEPVLKNTKYSSY